MPAHSFYPGYGGAASILDPEAEQFLNSGFEDLPVEDEEDWLDVQELTRLTQGQPKRMAAAMAIEVRFFFTPNRGSLSYVL